MGATAELTVKAVADGDNANLGAVLLTEQCDGASFARSIDTHDLGGHGQVLSKLLVDESLDVAELRALESGAVTEVEAQTRRRVLRARLGGVLRDDVTQARVDHVRGGVSARDSEATLAVNLGVGLLPHRHAALGQGAAVNAQATDRSLHVVNLNNATASETDRAVVGELTTHFRVERSAIENDLNLGGSARSGSRHTINEQSLHGRLGGLLRVAQERRAATHRLFDVVEDTNIRVAGLLRASVRARTLLLLSHQSAEALLVDRHTLLGGHLEGQVNREPVGIVQRERRRTRNYGGALRFLSRRNCSIQDRRPGTEGPAERVFFRVRDLGNRLPVGLKLGVGRLHRVLRGGEQRGHRGLVDAEQTHRTNGTANQAAQHVAATIVAGTHAVTNQHERGTNMVGHDTHTHVVVVGGASLGTRGAQAVALTAHLHGGIDDGEHLVDLVHVGLVLHHECQTLQAGARIDRLLVELAQQRVVLAGALTAHVLIEDQVPHLEVAVTTRVDSTAHGLGAIRGTTVVMPLGARTRGARLAGIPEVLLARQAHDVLGVHADLLGQHVESLVVLVPQGHPEAIAIQAVIALVARASQQLPRVVDGTFLEVIAEGEVTVHLEERAVTGRLADVVDVVRADALLNRRGARPRRRLDTRDVGDEGNHARDREQNRGLRRDERNGRTNLMTLLLEVVEPAGADFRRTHSPPC